MSYIPSPFDPRLADDAEACLGALLWRLLDASVGDDEALPEQPPLTAEDQALARVLEPLIEETSTCWRRRRDDALTRADVARTRDRVAAAAGSGSVAASLCGFLDDALALVGRLRPEEGETAERPWSRSLFDWTDDVPAGMPVVDLERAAGLSDAGWALYACASLHGLERWRHEAAAECLSLSRQAFVMAARLERWDVTLVHRGRHEAALAAVPDHGTAHAEHFILHNPNPIPDEIGRELARAHSRQQQLLGTLPLSATALAFDVAIQFRASYEEEVHAFFRGYEAGASDKLAAMLEDLGGVDPASHPGPSPDFEIAAPASYERAASTGLDLALCIASLRDEDGVQRALRERAEQLSSAEVTPVLAGLAAALACEALSVADDVAGAARASYLQTLSALFMQRRWEDVLQAVDAGLPYSEAFLDPSEAGVVDGYRLLALSRKAPPQGEPELVLAGCRAFARSADPAGLSFVEQVLRSELLNPAFGDHLDELIALLIGLHLRRAKLLRSLEPIVELRALLAAVRGDGLGDPTLVDIALRGSTALLGTDGGLEEMTEISAIAAEHRELADLVVLLEWAAPSPAPEAGAARSHLGAGVSEATHQALLDEDWPAVVRSTRADLAALPRGDGTAALRILLVGALARGLRGMADTTGDPAVVSAAARETRSLINAMGEQLLRFADLPIGEQDRALWLLSAGNLGLAGVALHRRSPDGAVPRSAVRLLERAAELAAQDADPLMRAGCMHDLGHAHLALAAELPRPEEALESLERAAALLREALVLHRELRRRPGGAIAMRGRSAHVDLLNLGLVYLEIARRLLAGGELPGGGPHAGPLYLRAALWTLSAGRDLALENGALPDVAGTDLQLAQVKTELAMACLEHTRANKGTFRREFRLFLAVIEQVPASTWEFASRYALSALHDVHEALWWSVERRDRSGVLAALDGAFRILGLAQLRHGVSGAGPLLDDNLWNMAGMRLATLVVLHEAFGGLIGAAPDMELEDARGEVADWTRFLYAQMRLERVRRQPNAGELAAAAAEFEQLRRSADPILRAFARPYADWFSVLLAEDRVAVNGLAVEPNPAGLEVILPAQGRSFVIGGLTEPSMTLLLREASWVKRNSTGAIASRLPQFDWSGAPAVVPVLAGTCCGGGAKFLIARLPGTGWDVWVMHLAVTTASEVDLTFPFALRGIFGATDARAGKRDGGTLGRGDVAVMDAAGLAVEVSIVRDEADPVVEVRRSGADT